MGHYTDNQAALNAGVNDMAAEGQGVWVIAIYPGSVVRDVLRDARQGDRHALDVFECFKALADSICTGPADTPRLCFLCERAFAPPPGTEWPAVLTTMHADVAQPKTCLIHGICRHCAVRYRDVEGLLAPIQEAVKQHIGIDDARILPPSSASGHA